MHSTITLTGTLDQPQLLPWIQGHAAKLGVRIQITKSTRSDVRFDACGATEMVQALALGCSLGPHGVWIEDVKLSPVEPTSEVPEN